MSDKRIVCIYPTVSFAEDIVRQRLELVKDYIDTLVDFPNLEDLDSVLEELKQIRGIQNEIELVKDVLQFAKTLEDVQTAHHTKEETQQ